MNVRWGTVVRLAEGFFAVALGVLAYELIQPASNLLSKYGGTFPVQDQLQATSAPTGLVLAVLAALAAGWLAKSALR